MSLVNCPECDRPNVSDTALVCPNCGFPIKDYYEKERAVYEEEQRKKEKEEIWNKNKKKLWNTINNHKKKIVICSMVLIIAIASFIIGLLVYYKPLVKQVIYTIEAGTDINYLDLISYENVKAVRLKSGFIEEYTLEKTDIVYEIDTKYGIKEYTATVDIVDTTPPSLSTLSTEIPWMSDVDMFDISSDDWVVVTDNFDSNPKINVISGNIDSKINGEYPVTYEVYDSNGNAQTVEVVYTVSDGLPENKKADSETFSVLQGVWYDEPNWNNNEHGSMIKIQGDSYEYRNDFGERLEGIISIRRSSKNQICEWYDFCIDLSASPYHLHVKVSEEQQSLSSQEGPASDGNFSIYEKEILLDLEKIFPIENYNEKDEPQIGMSKDEILNSVWGKPKYKNITETENIILEQWVYSSSRYIFFENGIVTSIQKKE